MCWGLLLLLAEVLAFRRIPAFKRRVPITLSMQGFDRQDVVVIQQAVGAWNEALKRPVFEVGEWSAASLWIVVDARFESAGTKLVAHYGSDSLWSVQNSTTYVSSLLHGNTLFNTIEHELGHCLGLEHSSDSPIMSHQLQVNTKGVPWPSRRVAITEDDVLGVLG